MKTSWTETAKIEEYLLQQGDIENQLLIEAQLQLDSELIERISAQQIAYTVIQQHGRQILIQEIKAVENKVFYHPFYTKFRQKILSFFK